MNDLTIRLCDLSKINSFYKNADESIGSFSDKNTKHAKYSTEKIRKKLNSSLNSNITLLSKELAIKLFIKNSTEEIQIKSISSIGEIDYKPNITLINKMKNYLFNTKEIYTTQATNTDTDKNISKIINLKSNKIHLNSSRPTQYSFTKLNMSEFNESFSYAAYNETGNINDRNMAEVLIQTLTNWLAVAKEWILSVIPQDDIVLAVIVPLIIIISMIVFTIVIVCLIHMCNRNYKDELKAKAIINSNSNRSTLKEIYPKRNTLGHSSKSNPIYKQKAYLSKGVPVILYEEMSDKPIDDYDENNRDVLDSNDSGNRSGASSSYYRSPLIMRNEKPPMPAPPEYSRQSGSNSQKSASEQVMLSEIQKILQKNSLLTQGEHQNDELTSLMVSNSNYSPMSLSSSRLNK
jgi:hypothetical protein